MIDTFSLDARTWRSPIIRGYCTVLSRSACYADLLTSLEPLDAIDEHSAEGVLLWIAFSECVGLPDVAEQARRIARVKWAGDGRFCTQKEAREQ